MGEAPPSYLTVKEAAGLLRTAEQTVYRWCRSGRIPAIKVGKEWRIPAAGLTRGAQFGGRMGLEQLLAGLAGRAHHLLAVACDTAGLARMEAAFFDAAARAGGHLVFMRWGGDAASVRQRLRPVVGSGRTGSAPLRVVDCARAYEEERIGGPLRLLTAEVDRAAASGRKCFAFASMYDYFGYHHDRLMALESAIDSGVGSQPLVRLCAYALSGFESGRTLSLLMQLSECHTGTVFFDGKDTLFWPRDTR
ncbi:MAG: helix-turn-helix domain-containing protein [Phenylobacterium sp.]|nr:helix-turn-helix domain-containing protein [Phenylobacterium sp.]